MAILTVFRCHPLLRYPTTMKRIIAFAVAFVAMACTALSQEYRVGRASADITLPVWGIQMLGYVHPQQVGEGLRQRQYARTFIVADAADKTRLAYVTCDIAFPTHTLKLAVLERLRDKLGERYGHANLILAGTHTHGAPGGYHHHLSSSVLGGDFFEQGFDALADGIAESLIAADADLKPAKIFLAQGDVAEANANRSSIAYRNNPESERGQYKHDVDKMMTLLRFVRQEGDVGLLNWFAVHPTSVNYHYKLTTSDNKGYAAYEVEKNRAAKSPGFVAAFANTNCGDATPNLNLDATGPGQTDIESCAIVGGRQAQTAEQLLESAQQEPLTGPIQIVHAFVDFSKLTVAEEFTGAEEAHTCPSAWGYAFAAGSDAEGGGHALFREGMTESDPGVDALVRLVLPKTKPSEEFVRCQKPKAILVATGLAQPPMHEQVLPLAVVRLGQLALVVGPAEFTTMSGRRFRMAVGRELGIDPRYVVVAGYSNDFAGYVTTWHEYQLQQYEGGHTLFGPWTEAGYRQEFVRLARALKNGATIEPSAEPADMRTRRYKKTTLDGPDERAPDGAQFGDVVTQPAATFKPGEAIACAFWTGSPVNDYRRSDVFLAVEKLVKADTWQVVRSDHDWDTTIQFQQTPAPGSRGNRAVPQPGLLNLAPPRFATRPEPFQATVTWETTGDTPPGTYRLVHYGRHKRYGKIERFTAVSPAFELRP